MFDPHSIGFSTDLVEPRNGGAAGGDSDPARVADRAKDHASERAAASLRPDRADRRRDAKRADIATSRGATIVCRLGVFARARKGPRRVFRLPGKTEGSHFSTDPSSCAERTPRSFVKNSMSVAVCGGKSCQMHESEDEDEDEDEDWAALA